MPTADLADPDEPPPMQPEAIGLLQEFVSADDPTVGAQLAVSRLAALARASTAYVSMLTNYDEFTCPLVAAGMLLNHVPRLNVRERSLTAHVLGRRRAYFWPGGRHDQWYRPLAPGGPSLAAEILVPLLYNRQAVGLLSLGYASTRTIPANAGPLALQICSLISNIIQSRRFFDASLRLGELVIDSDDPAGITASLARAAMDLLQCPAASVWLINPASNDLEPAASEGITPASRQLTSLSQAEGGLGWDVIRSLKAKLAAPSEAPVKLPAQMHGAEMDIQRPGSAFRNKGMAAREELRSVVVMPLVAGQEILGVINVFSRRRRKFFEKETVLLRSLALRGAAAIANSRLQHEAHRLNEVILAGAQVANPGLIAIGFTHDARSRMHDINALLSSVLHLLPQRQREEEPGKAVIAALVDNLAYLRTLFHSLTDVAKATELRAEPIELGTLLATVSYLFKFRKGRHEFVEPSRATKEVRFVGYPDQMLQVLINLVNNAIAAIELTRRKGTIEFVAERTDSFVHVEVRDTGLGIPPENLPRVFDPSFTTKGRAGSGFGLAICRRIVEDYHHGQIWATASLEQGTVFHIKLPLGPVAGG
ncbi:MAG: ATP-binding protein [Gemmatimonadales bacterium]